MSKRSGITEESTMVVVTEARKTALRAHGIGARSRYLNLADLDDEFAYYISTARTKTGERLTESALKKIRDAAEMKTEIAALEVSVAVAYEIPDRNGIYSRLVKVAEKVDILSLCGDRVLTEEARRYIGKSKEPIKTRRFRSIGGTRERGEEVKTAACREVKQEAGWEVRREDLYPLNVLQPDPMNPENWRESSVYDNTEAVDIIHRLVLFREQIESECIETPPDNGVIVYFAWRRWEDLMAKDSAYRATVPPELHMLLTVARLRESLRARSI